MANDFPTAPTIGDTVAFNNILYSWDGTKWNGSQNANLDSRFVQVAGDTMTGALNVPAGATTTQVPQVQEVVQKSGDTMTGALNVPAGATTTQVPQVQEVVQKSGDTMTGDLVINTTGALTIPVGTTAQQPSPTAAGQVRLNSDTGFYDVATDATTVRQLAYLAPDPAGITSLTVTNGSTLPNTGVYDTITIPAGVTCYAEGSCSLSAVNDIIIDGTIIGTDRGPASGEAFLYTNIAFNYILLIGGGRGVGPSPGGISTDYTSGVGALGGVVASPQALSGTSGSAGGLSVICSSVATSAGLTNYGGTTAGGLFLRTKLGNITVGASANIQFDGGDAPVGLRYAGIAAVQTQGNGGGSGGTIVLQVDGTGTLALNAGCSFSANGGAGSAPNSAGVTEGSGGGGGGGGYIIFNALTTTGSATTSVTGGAGGPAFGNNATIAAAGGGNGGRGGNGGVSDPGTTLVTQAQAGDAGQVLSNIFLF